MRPANELVRDALRPLYRGTERAVRRWFPSQYDNLEWNRKMAEGYARRAQPGGAALGEEWSRPEDLDEILEEFLFPFVDERSAVAEIGVGGGRVAARVLPRVAKLYAFDISPRMLRAARSALAGRGEVEYVLLREPRLPEELTGALDLVYSFATFLHLDLHMMHRYIAETARVLRPGGHAFLQTATITTPDGWARFAAQEQFSVSGFYFVSPELVRTLAERTGLVLVKESEPSADNRYLNRDYFAVFRR